MNARGERFPLFDSLRALAALAIVGTHAASHTGATPLRPYGARLEAGVAIFFVISGFLLYRPFARARLHGERPPRLLAYGWRRALRIAPAYWVALLVTTVWLGTSGVFTLHDGPLYFGFGQTYSQSTIGGGLAQAWTLCIEVTFYAFLPLWAWAMRALPGGTFAVRVRGEAVALAGLFAFSVGYKALLLSGANPHQIVITPQLEALPSFLDQFALGMGLAVITLWLERRPELPRPLRAIDRFPALCWIVAAVAFWLAAKRIGLTGRLLEPFTPGQYLERHLLYAAIGIGIVTPAAIGTRGLVRRLLAHRSLMWVGLVSYSIYLYSAAVLEQIGRWGFHPAGRDLAFLWWVLLGIAGSIVVAAASYYAIERPALSLKRLVPSEGTLRRGEALVEPAPAVPEG